MRCCSATCARQLCPCHPCPGAIQVPSIVPAAGRLPSPFGHSRLPLRAYPSALPVGPGGGGAVEGEGGEGGKATALHHNHQPPSALEASCCACAGSHCLACGIQQQLMPAPAYPLPACARPARSSPALRPAAGSPAGRPHGRPGADHEDARCAAHACLALPAAAHLKAVRVHVYGCRVVPPCATRPCCVLAAVRGAAVAPYRTHAQG